MKTLAATYIALVSLAGIAWVCYVLSLSPEEVNGRVMRVGTVLVLLAAPIGYWLAMGTAEWIGGDQP